jgi:hypothetical protein
VNERQTGGIVRVAIGLLVVELLVVAAALIVLVLEILTTPASSLESALALAVLAVLAVIWMVAMIVGMARGRAWVRGSAIVWQLLQLAVGVSALTGAGSQPLLGWPLVALGAVSFVLLLSPPLVRALSDRTERA